MMASLFGCSSGFKYARYSSSDPEINIKMDYLAGWKFTEDRGAKNSYAQVVFIEPLETRKEKPLGASLAVTVIDSSNIGVSPATIETVADDIVKKRLMFSGAKVMSRSDMKMRNRKAVDILLSYKRTDKIYSYNPKMVSVKERIVIFEDGTKFYMIKYKAREEPFEKYNKAINHCVSSLRLKT